MKDRLRKLMARRTSAGARGMTLIEIMVVVFILGLIATVVAVAVGGQADEARVEKARLDIKGFEQGLDLYKLKKGRYPNTSEGLGVLFSSGILKGQLGKDPWDRDYVYLSPGQRNPKGYDIISYGPDGVQSEDDVSNSTGAK